MRILIFAFCVCVLLFAACARKPAENDVRTAEYIENYISQLKEIEKVTTRKFNNVMAFFENADENTDDSLLFHLRDAIVESIEANRTAVEEFRALASRPKPDFVDDTVHILLRTAASFLGMSYETRITAQTWLNRYISLGTPRFFREYSEGMEEAMQASRQAFFFITAARMRQRYLVGDTLDLTQEFLQIPELPELPESDVEEGEEEEEEAD